MLETNSGKTHHDHQQNEKSHRLKKRTRLYYNFTAIFWPNVSKKTKRGDDSEKRKKNLTPQFFCFVFSRRHCVKQRKKNHRDKTII